MNDQLLKYQTLAEESELGKQSQYSATYNPNHLYPIPRSLKREEIGIDPARLPFFGFDCWNHYEVSWFNEKGKPLVAVAEIVYDCNSPKIVESKSLKLYFNSLNNTRFEHVDVLEKTIESDLATRIEADVQVKLYSLHKLPHVEVQRLVGECIDHLDVTCSEYLVNPTFLTINDEVVSETLYSDLLKSNCLITNQPDWGSVLIAYKGPKIDREGLLKYIISFRDHNEFHEQCIERIFMDILWRCKPESLTVYGRYTRRGGLDINPYRSTEKSASDGKNLRLVRQ